MPKKHTTHSKTHTNTFGNVNFTTVDALSFVGQFFSRLFHEQVYTGVLM